MKAPKISIITVVYNGVETIEATILSVLKQSYKNLEYIVIDGESTDGTIDLIQKHATKISIFKSEQDSGLYDAMNKGLKVATGDFCMFLNAGDLLYKGSTLAEYVGIISHSEKLYFATAVMTDKEKIYRLRPPANTEIATWLKQGNLPNHQSMLFPRSFYSKNFYDLKFKTASDDDYKMRALSDCEVAYLPKWTILFELGGVSRDSSSLKRVIRRNREVKAVLAKNKSYHVKSRTSYYKYVIKSYILWLLTTIFGHHYQLELYFNKFQKIPQADKAKFQAQL